MLRATKNEFLRSKPSDGNREQLEAGLNKLGFAVVLLIGAFLSTQSLAKMFDYNPAMIGYPQHIIENFMYTGKSYPVYAPWKIYSWFLTYAKRPDLHTYFNKALVWQFVFAIIAIVVYTIITYFRGFKQSAQNVFGTARWAKIKDLKKAGLIGSPTEKSGIILGQLNDAIVSCEYDKEKDTDVLHLKLASDLLMKSGTYNILLAAPTRSGKGVSSVIPTLLSYWFSVIVLDFKGENFNLTSGYRAKFSKILRYAPVGDCGQSFNPLMEIRGGKDAFSDADMIADILTTPAGGNTKSDANSDHFRIAAKELLTAVILHVLTCPDIKDKSLPGCASFIKSVNPEHGKEADPKYICKIMIYSRHCDETIHRHIVEGAANQLKRPDNEGGSVLSTANNALTIFSDDHIRDNSSKSEIHLDDFEKSDIPISLYLTIPNSDRDRIKPLIRMFIILLSRKFSSGETQATERKLKVPVLFILDEFDKLGKYDELHTNMGIHNGYGIHYFLIIQSINQLNDIYGRDHSFLAHCNTQIVFAPGETASAKEVSEYIGKETIWKTNTSNSGSRFSVGLDNVSLSGQEQERSLINPDEVMKLPKDQLILLNQNRPPYIGKKVVYYEDPRFKDKTKIKPPFLNRKEALLYCDPLDIESPELWFNQIDYSYSVEQTEDGVLDEMDIKMQNEDMRYATDDKFSLFGKNQAAEIKSTESDLYNNGDQDEEFEQNNPGL
ncbi:MAG: conjugal transfer protein TraG [Termitinemataceae bacterium]|nr:MAG: conjugal transfer protein TraG [Termitinemataceae bacterium]